MRKTFDEVVDAIATDFAVIGCREQQELASNSGRTLFAEQLVSIFNGRHEYMSDRIRRLNQSLATAPSAEEPVKE